MSGGKVSGGKVSYIRRTVYNNAGLTGGKVSYIRRTVYNNAGLTEFTRCTFTKDISWPLCSCLGQLQNGHKNVIRVISVSTIYH